MFHIKPETEETSNVLETEAEPLETCYMEGQDSLCTSEPHVKMKTFNMNLSAYSNILDGSSGFSSATIVNGAVSCQNPMEVTTFHVPVLGLEETVENIEIELPCYNPTIGLSMAVENLEIPVHTMYAEDEVQTVEVADCDSLVECEQPVVIASTDSRGNCFVTMPEKRDVPHNQGKPVVWRRTGTKTLGRPARVVGRSRMIADRVTSITATEFKAQLNDTSDILRTLDLAPSTKRKMYHLARNGKLFAGSGRVIKSPACMSKFTRHLITKTEPVQEVFADMELMPLGYQREVDPSTIKRITRRRRYPEAEEYQRKLMQQTFNNLVAESQKNMEAALLNNPVVDSLKCNDNVEMLVEAAEGGCHPSLPQYESEQVMRMYSNEDVKDSIIVIHDGEETAEGTAYTHQNIEVLLAAAANSGVKREDIHQLIICQKCPEPSVLIVPNDPLADIATETVVTS